MENKHNYVVKAESQDKNGTLINQYSIIWFKHLSNTDCHEYFCLHLKQSKILL